MDKGPDLYAGADIKESDSLRSVYLMGAGAHHVNMIFVHINGHMAVCLHRICVEGDPVLLCDFTDFPDRLDDTDLVIGKHDGNQNGIRTNGIS